MTYRASTLQRQVRGRVVSTLRRRGISIRPFTKLRYYPNEIPEGTFVIDSKPDYLFDFDWVAATDLTPDDVADLIESVIKPGSSSIATAQLE